MKICSTCKNTRQLSNFSKDKSKKSGYSYRCKSCQSKLSKLHYLNNKDKYIETQRRNEETRRAFLKEAKSKPCTDCSIEYPYWMMQFDHLKDKDFTIGTEGYRVGLERLKAEVEKCEVVCANCHAHRTFIRSSRNNPDW